MAVEIQRNQVDSLNLMLKRNVPDTTKVLLLNSICKEYLSFNTDSSILAGIEGINLAVKAGFQRGEALCRSTVSTAYYRQGNFPASLDQSLISLKIAESIGDKKLLAENYLSLGDVYTDFANDSLGLYFYDKALGIAEKEGFEKTIAEIKGSLAQVYVDNRNYEKALKCYEEVESICLSLKYEYGLALSCLNLGDIYLSIDRYEKALVKLDEGLKRARELNDLRLEAGCLTLKARYCFKKGLNSEGISFSLEALEIADNLKNTQFIHAASLNLYNYYSGTGDYRKALLYFQKSQEASEETTGEERLRALNNLIYKNEILLKQKEIALLYQNEKTARLKVTGLVIILIILFISAIYVIWSSYQLKKVNVLLEKKNAEIGVKSEMLAETNENMERKIEERTMELAKERHRSLRAILEGQESERERIAQDLHDSLSIRLIGLRRSVEPIVYDDSSKLLAEIDGIIGQVREISHNLMPFALRKFGLIKAVEDLCHSFASPNSLNIRFSTVGIKQNQRWDPLIESEIFRIIQELLANIVKHSGADDVFVEIISDLEMLFITVEDNGCGFNLNEVSGFGMGLRNIKARSHLLGGSLSIDTLPGKGTTVMLNFPVKK